MAQSETENKIIETARELAWAYHDAGRPEAAIKTLRNAIDVVPQSVALYDCIGYIYCVLGWYEDVVTTVEEMVKNGGEHTAITWNNLGVAYRELGRNQEAEEAYCRALQMDPQITEVRTNLASLYHYDLKQSERAIGLLQEGIETNPRDIDLSGRISSIYINLGQYGNAVKTFESMVANGGEHNTDTWSNLGVAYHRLKRYPEAEGAYQESLKMDPDSAYPYIGLARLEVGFSGEEGVDPLRAISLIKRAFDNARGEEADKDVPARVFTLLNQVTNGTSLSSAEQIMYEWSEASPSLGMR
jgi:tetratricopeptide (TPR) repeat protein